MISAQKYSEAKKEEICGYLIECPGKGKAAEKAGIDRHTLLQWEKTIPDFTEAVKKARQEYYWNLYELHKKTTQKNRLRLLDAIEKACRPQ